MGTKETTGWFIEGIFEYNPSRRWRATTGLDAVIFDATIKSLLNEKLGQLEAKFDADVIFYFGEIHPALLRPFRDLIEDLKKETTANRQRLVIILNTAGGSAEIAEKMVDITRFHYEEVFFIVPDFAMSAGTVFCMSGNRIYMDYSSSLGPIDPQVWNGQQYVPALGYLDKVEELLEKARVGTLTNAEFLILQSQDLAMLSRYEQAKNLTITLLKKWLVEYKFRDWTVHQTSPGKIGQPVTDEEKVARAKEIARQLGDNRYWHSHGRMIGIATLRELLRLRIEDYSTDATLQPLLRSYNDLITEYIAKNNYKVFLHSRNQF
ncbi:MAG: serine dehydrogenasease [Acidobacteria bacterium]|nr:serine dehydrogenasease [Acidobacteriota bacterium]